MTANLMAMLVQYLFAMVGVAAELNMPELCRKHVPRPVTYGFGQVELAAMATGVLVL